MTMTRLATGAALLVLMVATAHAEQTHVLKLSTHVPPSNAMIAEFERWGAELAERSQGRIKLEIYPAGQMGPPPQQYDIARTGVADIAYIVHGFSPGRFPLTEIAHLPGLFKDGKSGTEALSSLVDEYLAKEHEGVRLLYVVAVPPFPILTRDKQVHSIEDLSNLRIRHPGSVIAGSLSALGAVPVAVPPAEMGDALAKGVIDGTATTYEAAETFKLVDSLSYATRIDFGTSTFALVMNPDAYSRLPEDLRTVIDETTGASAGIRVGKLYDDVERAAIDRLSGKITAIELTGEARAQFEQVIGARIEAVLAEQEAKGLPARAFYKSLKQVD